MFKGFKNFKGFKHGMTTKCAAEEEKKDEKKKDGGEKKEAGTKMASPTLRQRFAAGLSDKVASLHKKADGMNPVASSLKNAFGGSSAPDPEPAPEPSTDSGSLAGNITASIGRRLGG